jgi:hypothetical protein
MMKSNNKYCMATIMLVSIFALVVPIGMTESFFTAYISSGSVAVGQDFVINGTSHTPDVVGIVIVSPRGENGDKIDGSGKGVYYASVSGSAFSKKITVGSDIDTGSYLVAVLSPGRDGYYKLGNGADVDDFFDEFEEQYAITGKSQAQVLELLKDAIGVAGSDDLIQVGYVAVTTVPVTEEEEETIPLYLPYESRLFSYGYYNDSYVIGRSWNNNLSDNPDKNSVIVRLSSTEEIIFNGGYFLKPDRKTRADSWSEVDAFVPTKAPIYNYTSIIAGSRVGKEGTITITTTKVSYMQEPIIPNKTKLIIPFFFSYSLKDASKNTISYTEDAVTFVGTNVKFENNQLPSEYTLDKNNITALYVDENGITQRTTNVEVEISHDIRSAKIVAATGTAAPTDVPTATPTAEEEEGEGLPETPSPTAETTPMVTEPTSSPTITPTEHEEEQGAEYPIPGFEAIFAIAGLVAAVVCLLRKK